ncbi:unnamed protein product [Penicillium manginii]
MEDTLSHVMAVWERQRSSSPIYSLLLESIEIYHAEHGIIHATLPVRALHVNSKGTLHGTLSACVVDWAAGMAIASTGHQVTGVTKLGDTLEIQGKIGKIGKTLAFTTITIGKRVEEGIVNVVQGSHTKYIRQ